MYLNLSTALIVRPPCNVSLKNRRTIKAVVEYEYIGLVMMMPLYRERRWLFGDIRELTKSLSL